jgi:general L-amino acid transport system substrate-binding protein
LARPGCRRLPRGRSAIFGDDTGQIRSPARSGAHALQSGEIDLLVRNSTWTFSRNNDLGLEFVAVNHYDGKASWSARSSASTAR